MGNEDKGLRIATRIVKCEFNIHTAMMDEGLGQYGEIILALLDEGYGFKSGDWDKGKKWIVSKNRTVLNLDELKNELETALILIFRLLNEFKKEIINGGS